MAYSTYMPGAFPAQPAPAYYSPAAYPQQAYPAPQPAPQAYPPAAPQQAVNARMVTSREEASAAQIPFDSTINIFINLPADEIYIKRFDMNTGGAIFAEYRRGQRQQPAQSAPAPDNAPSTQYATQDMLEQLRGDVGAMRDELEDVKTALAKRARRAADE